MQQMFYVAHAGEPSGPFSLDDIFNKIESKQLELNDFIFDEQSQDWVMLMAYPALSDKVKGLKPQAPPAKPSASSAVVPATATATVEWFVLKGEHKFGPFAYADLIKLLQDKSVFEYDYVWHARLKSWQRIAETEDFKPERIRDLKASNFQETSEIFFRRRHIRVSHGTSLIVHDNKTVWKGQSFEISEGGAGIVIENALIQPGHHLYIHFKPADDLPPFNAVCEVVGKRFTEVEDRTSPVQYGVRFLKLDEHAEKAIRGLTNKVSTAA